VDSRLQFVQCNVYRLSDSNHSSPGSSLRVILTYRNYTLQLPRIKRSEAIILGKFVLGEPEFPRTKQRRELGLARAKLLSNTQHEVLKNQTGKLKDVLNGHPGEQAEWQSSA